MGEPLVKDGQLSGKTMLVSGGSRGIGLAIAVRAARAGCNVALLAKTAQPHPRIEGTVFTAAEQVEAAGGRAIALVGDVRREDDVHNAVARTAETFGGLDIVVNNAAAINLSPTPALSMKNYDLIQSINTRGTFLVSKTALPHLEKSGNAHILNVSPPLNLHPRWAGAHLGYTISKYGVSLCTLGLADELADRGVAVNSLWPRTAIATAAIRGLLGADAPARARKPEIMADAACVIVSRDSRMCTGNFFTDEEVLRAEGVEDFSGYRLAGREEDLDLDFYLPDAPLPAR